MLRTDDALSLMMKDDKGRVLGFAMGYLVQYDDLAAYKLEEIVIAYHEQHKGYGSALLTALEKRIKEKGGAGVELLAVNDAAHEAFYGRAGYQNAGNFLIKCKWFD